MIPELDSLLSAAEEGCARIEAGRSRAARSYANLVSLLLRLGQKELVVANLGEALAHTHRRWNALDRILIPGVALRIRRVESAPEEKARDEVVRGRRPAQEIARSLPGCAPVGAFDADAPFRLELFSFCAVNRLAIDASDS